jgi:hypothetical protein
MGDHLVGTARVTSHGDRVVDRRPGAGAKCHHWYTREGWAKCEVEVARGVDEDTDGNVSVKRGCRGHAWRGCRGRTWHGHGHRGRVVWTWTSRPRVARAGTSRPRVAWTWTSGPCVARAGTSRPRVVQAGATGLRVAWRQSPRYLQQKKGRVELWLNRRTGREGGVQVVRRWVEGGKGEGWLVKNDVSEDQHAVCGEI